MQTTVTHKLIPLLTSPNFPYPNHCHVLITLKMAKILVIMTLPAVMW